MPISLRKEAALLGTAHPASAAQMGGKRTEQCVAEVVSGHTAPGTSEIPTRSNGSAIDARSPDRCTLPGIPADENTTPVTLPKANSSEKQSELLASSLALELASWRNIIGLPGLRRTIATAFWSPAVYVYHRAASAACTLLPYFWESNPAAASRESPGYCAYKQFSLGSLAACSVGRLGPASSGSGNLEAAPSPEVVLARMSHLACVSCPHCSGVFCWQDAEHVSETGGADLPLKQSDLAPPQHAYPASSNSLEAVVDCALQLVPKPLPLPRLSMRSSGNPGGQEPHQDTTNNRAEAADYSSEGQSAQALVGARQPKWIRFLARRLRCIHVHDDRRVLESHQCCQGQGHAGRHRHLRLRRRRRITQEPPNCKDWQVGSEPGVSVASAHAVAKLHCSSSGPDRSSEELKHYRSSNSHSASMRNFSESAAAISYVTPGNDDAEAASRAQALLAASPCDSSAVPASAGPAAVAEGIERITGMASGLHAGRAAPGPQADHTATDPGVNLYSSQIGVWPLIPRSTGGTSDLREAFDKLGQQRLRFNSLQREAAPLSVSNPAWNRRLEMQHLSDLLVNASVTSMLVLDCAMPCVHSHDGLQVWKGESGAGSFACRGEPPFHTQ